MGNNVTASSLMECLLDAHTATKINEDMAGTVAEGNYHATDYKLQPPSNSAVKLLSATLSKIELALVNIGVVTKTDVEAIIENPLTKWTNTVQSQIVQGVEFTFKEASQANHFNLNKRLKSAWINVVKKSLGKMVRSRHVVFRIRGQDLYPHSDKKLQWTQL